jgi:hypothetical protein
MSQQLDEVGSTLRERERKGKERKESPQHRALSGEAAPSDRRVMRPRSDVTERTSENAQRGICPAQVSAAGPAHTGGERERDGWGAVVRRGRTIGKRPPAATSTQKGKKQSNEASRRGMEGSVRSTHTTHPEGRAVPCTARRRAKKDRAAARASTRGPTPRKVARPKAAAAADSVRKRPDGPLEGHAPSTGHTTAPGRSARADGRSRRYAHRGRVARAARRRWRDRVAGGGGAGNARRRCHRHRSKYFGDESPCRRSNPSGGRRDAPPPPPTRANGDEARAQRRRTPVPGGASEARGPRECAALHMPPPRSGGGLIPRRERDAMPRPPPSDGRPRGPARSPAAARRKGVVTRGCRSSPRARNHRER